jgi:hypothetical protein
MVRLFMLLFGLGLVLTIVALISCLSAEDDEVRALPRLVWVIVILLLPVVGPTIYLAAGRPMPDAASGSSAAGEQVPGTAGRIWRAARGLSTRQQRTPPPDDDPEFLRSIDSTARAREDETLRRWEEEFRRGPDDQRKRDKSIDDPGTDDR